MHDGDWTRWPRKVRNAAMMDIRPLTEDYAVSPQISPQDVAAISAAGYRTIICNRPDSENPEDLFASAVGAAAARAGLDFVMIPITHQTLTPEVVARQMSALAASQGPVLAYCASGTRCSIVWSLGQAGKMSADEILAATARHGYDLSHLRDRLEVAPND